MDTELEHRIAERRFFYRGPWLMGFYWIGLLGYPDYVKPEVFGKYELCWRV